ncbi:hypothetical protein OsccyDRAFT_0227 [Leptolyngbyaceae cyanobacterium JSC-12]|nr:hypothetical protein OsccyDRAFT_0227 [Leptolyngbyaceae cyanobacterium JSC-12]
MNRVPSSKVDTHLVQTRDMQNEVTTEPDQTEPAEEGLAESLAPHHDILLQASQLTVRTKVAFIRTLITQLETNQIQSILEFGLREISDRYRHGTTQSITPNTRLILKKDYSYQERGLSEPTQYYVYLRRRKPKLDRYIGALFYIPEGCMLSYYVDPEGRVIFNPPHNVFQLQDTKNSAIVQIVRLLCLVPPPPEYTFAKQQNDVPDIQLHVEYLDLQTHQPIAKQAYPFPSCMHEGGRLDRYRWEVSTIIPSSEASVLLSSAPKTSILSESLTTSSSVISKLSHQVLDLPKLKPIAIYMANQNEVEFILKRMRLWVSWSEKAIPQSRWEIIQDDEHYLLINAVFKRRILKFSMNQASITLENSLPVLAKWFHDLGLAVSQAQNQQQYSTAQLKLARNLLVEMSLPQKDPILFLKQLFGIEFSNAQ